jgi:hypothetical protein
MLEPHVKDIVQRQGKRLNTDLFFEELRPLLQLNETPEIEGRLRKNDQRRKASWDRRLIRERTDFPPAREDFSEWRPSDV